MNRSERILSLAPVVDYHANAIRRRLPATSQATIEDLRSAGWMGAIEAVDRWRPDGGASLRSFADPAVRGRMLDLLRSVDPLSRGHRRDARAGRAAEPVFVPLEAVQAPAARDGVEGRLRVEQLLRVARLSPAQVGLVRGYFLDGRKLVDLAAAWRLRPVRACQLKGAALAAMRAAA
jgi:hypothetical protein